MPMQPRPTAETVGPVVPSWRVNITMKDDRFQILSVRRASIGAVTPVGNKVVGAMQVVDERSLTARLTALGYQPTLVEPAERRPFRDNPRLILLGIVILLLALVAMVTLADRAPDLNPNFLTEVVLYALSAAGTPRQNISFDPL